MNWTYDTEFLEDGKTIEFISIGMVCIETGEEYYAVSNEFDTRRVAKDDWLMENVMSSIEHDEFIVTDADGFPFVRDIYVTDLAAKSRQEIAEDIFHLLAPDRAPELWAWYSAYDHVCLAQLWGKMINLPGNVPMYTNDIKTLVKLAGNPPLPGQPAGNHNALEDARWNKVRYDNLRRFLTI